MVRNVKSERIEEMLSRTLIVSSPSLSTLLLSCVLRPSPGSRVPDCVGEDLFQVGQMLCSPPRLCYVCWGMMFTVFDGVEG